MLVMLSGWQLGAVGGWLFTEIALWQSRPTACRLPSARSKTTKTVSVPMPPLVHRARVDPLQFCGAIAARTIWAWEPWASRATLAVATAAWQKSGALTSEHDRSGPSQWPSTTWKPVGLPYVALVNRQAPTMTAIRTMLPARANQ